jgi:mono/diheme cytochrome c family protein
MQSRSVLVGIIVVVGVAVGLRALGQRATASQPVVINQTAVPPVATLDAGQVARGRAIYDQHCASCHGANLEGEPNWKTPLPGGAWPAPPHDSSGHTWHHPDDLLLDIIENGGNPALNSQMPGFRDSLDARERQAVLEFIKSRWEREERQYQWWITLTSKGP